MSLSLLHHTKGKTNTMRDINDFRPNLLRRLDARTKPSTKMTTRQRCNSRGCLLYTSDAADDM
eukprot:7262569-Prorocentrum_lima.AAC.1